MSACCKCRRSVFDESAFRRLLRKHADPDVDTVAAFARAATVDPALRLRVLSKLRGDAVATPAAILTIYALGLTALTFIVNLLLSLMKPIAFDDETEGFWRSESLVVVGLVLAGVVIYFVVARRQKCATMWKLAFEDALK